MNIQLGQLTIITGEVKDLAGVFFSIFKHDHQSVEAEVLNYPESELHPQLQFLEARNIVDRVNAGEQIVVVTHSDYILSEINNQIMYHCDFFEKEYFEKEHGYSGGGIAIDHVRSYVLDQDGVVEECEKNDYGITNSSMDGTLIKLNDASHDLYKYMNRQDNYNKIKLKDLTVFCGELEKLDLEVLHSKADQVLEYPETELHPARQIQRMREVVESVIRGEKTILLTHSNYMLRELNNLIILGSLSKENLKPKLKDFVAKHEYSPLQEKGIPLESVGVYTVSQCGEIFENESDESGYSVPSIGDVIDKLNEAAEFLYSIKVE